MPPEEQKPVERLVDRMEVEYDPQTDTLTITLRDARIRESDEVRPGVIADFGYDGRVRNGGASRSGNTGGNSA